MASKKPWNKQFMSGGYTEAEKQKAWNLGLRKKDGKYVLKKKKQLCNR